MSFLYPSNILDIISGSAAMICGLFCLLFSVAFSILIAVDLYEIHKNLFDSASVFKNIREAGTFSAINMIITIVCFALLPESKLHLVSFFGTIGAFLLSLFFLLIDIDYAIPQIRLYLRWKKIKRMTKKAYMTFDESVCRYLDDTLEKARVTYCHYFNIHADKQIMYDMIDLMKDIVFQIKKEKSQKIFGGSAKLISEKCDEMEQICKKVEDDRLLKEKEFEKNSEDIC